MRNPYFLWFLHWLVSALAIFVTAKVVPGFKVRDFGSAMIAALLVAIVSWCIRPVLLFISMPLNVLTLGFFTFVVDAVILKISAEMLSGFKISGWLSAILGALVLAILSMVLHTLMI